MPVPFLGEITALLSSACWAGASLVYATAGAGTRPVVLNMFKCGLAAALLVATACVVDGWGFWRVFGVDEAWALVGSGLVGLTLADTLYFQTLKRLGARRTLLLLSLQAPLAAVLAACTLHESITWAMLGGIALTTAGVAWVVSERVRGGTQAPATFAGVALGVLAALGNASANVLTKFGSAEHSALSVGAVRLAIGTVGLGVHLLLAGEGPALVAVVRDRRLAVRLTGAMFLGTYLGIWLVSAAIRYAPASVATTLSSTSPLFVLPLAVVFLRERVSVRAVLGTVLAIAGIALLFARSP